MPRLTRRGALAVPLAATGALPFLAPFLAGPAHAAAESRWFATSDGARLHYLEAGRPDGRSGARTLVFVPGWSMPAWIWSPQLDAFGGRFRAVALDPRGQGESEVTPGGYTQDRRGADIGELIARLGGGPVVLVGWSLGVLDSLAYLHDYGDSRIAGLVLVDNSIGEDPPPTPPRGGAAGPRLSREARMAGFVRGMFREPRSAAYLDRLTEDALRLPEPASRALLRYPVPRSYWREAVYSTRKPVLYVVRPRFAGQADNLARNHPNAETVIVPDAGHAMFVDQPARFNAMLLDFIQRRVWPS
ncbi:alpha/beta hydrolase [Roseomonas sp. NAR14]|uniref:Alpha/beta hydrolase n=1 Tax=Roseomonas acroporae TaxID=2937791 RepID=A0A9X1YAN7_9PROT|nr:alpha/beta hydrolase [Roseomonas acroporae]MCK8786954.1 alpha/beta hydrolase [Roseomonas acroporae]